MTAEAMRGRVDEASDVLVALANANRLMILCHLLEGELSVNALQAKVDLTQSALSQHLAKLKALKIVSTRRQAQSIFYSVSSDKVRAILALVKDLYCPTEP
jgi:ArsR family transcriptional regulator, virulence genes transcriptional regulator